MMRVVAITVFLISTAAGKVIAQSPQDTAIAIARLDAEIAALENVLEKEVWPGYRYSQLGLMYVIPGRAKIAAHWPGPGPSGMKPLPGFDAVLWTDTSVVRWSGGLPVASLAIAPTQSRAAITGLAMHEAFHAFEATQRKTGRRFGLGENSMLTSQYPVFDVENEAGVATEARLLRSAVLAKTAAEAKTLARQFIAVRKQRQERLDTTFANFEKLAEMHEGLAQYVLLRGLHVLAQHNPEYRDGAAAERQSESDLLRNTLARTDLSVRRRAYAMGSFMGLLLDRLAPGTWKQRVMQRDEFLQDIIADVVGAAPVSARTQAMIQTSVADAAHSVARLRELRIKQRDEILAKEGLTLVVDPSALTSRFDWCGFDPQNLITTGAGQLLHNRMVNLCSGGKTIARIYQPSVEDQLSGRVMTPVDPADLKITVNGSSATLPANGESVRVENLKIATGNLEVEIPRALVVLGSKTLVLIPLP